MTATEIARLVVYVIGAGTGAALAVIGGLNGDSALLTAGLGLLGVGGLAGSNINRSAKHG